MSPYLVISADKYIISGGKCQGGSGREVDNSRQGSPYGVYIARVPLWNTITTRSWQNGEERALYEIHMETGRRV